MGKTKARDCVPGWPRSRSTSAFTGVRIMPMNGYRYRILRLPWDKDVRTIDVEQHSLVTDEFRYTTEAALEAEYHRGQEEMVARYRAEYRTLTEEDKYVLNYAGDETLQAAIKLSLYKQATDNLTWDVLLAIKSIARNDKPFWYRFRRAQTDNSALFA